MLNTKRIGWAVAAALSLVIGYAPAARALTRSDRPSAVLYYPLIQVNNVTHVDTVVVLSSAKVLNSTSVNAVTAHCFYINGNSHCSNTGGVCSSSLECNATTFGVCLPTWTETDFNVTLTPDQPLTWSARAGLSKFPLTGLRCSNAPQTTCLFNSQCPTGGSCTLAGNSGSLVPPVPEFPFLGELKCIEVNPATDTPNTSPNDTNDLMGNASLEHILADGTIDVAKYNAVGLTSNGNNNGDNDLVLAAGNEYEGCASTLIVDHLFDTAIDPINPNNSALTDLTLVPCSEDLRTGSTAFGASTAQFLVFNEFEQRFSTSRRVDCVFNSQLSLIDTTQASHSIFSAQVSGTVAGQTRIRGIGGGLTGVARLTFVSGAATGWAAYNIHQDIGERDTPDIIRLP